ncbi:MAG: MFS transporter [Bacteroidales bacterium]|nr:MFS transporter [Bacteroidales bacterium]
MAETIAKKRNPWLWIPSLYFAEGIPYVAVMTLSVIMYKRLGISNTDIALYTGWLYLPWVIKPFWSPFVDLLKTKRWWTIAMQFIMAIGFAAIALFIPASLFFRLTLAAFWLVALTSATHDIAADGFYMHGLTTHQQSLYVGIRSTFYRVATVVGQGLLVILAGLIETNTGLEPAKVGVIADADSITMVDKSEKRSDTPYFSFVEAQDITSVEQVKRANTENGFYKEELPAVTTAAVNPKEESGFTRWVRETFGEKNRGSSAASDRVYVIGVKLSQRPAEGKSEVLNVSFKEGDQSVKLEQNKLQTRFEFTQNNWDKTAYLLFYADKNIKDKTTAVFEGVSGNIPMAWLLVFAALSVFFLITAIYHSWALPRPVSDKASKEVTARNILKEFLLTFKSFFSKKGVVPAILFMLLYRLPEAQLVKLINPFMLDPQDVGGLGLTTGQVGFVYGTVGILGLTIGGILGGLVAAKDGLKKWLWPMVCAITLPDLVYVFLSYMQQSSLLTINICIFIEQFGYGFGFTAYMLYLIYFSEGEHKTSHYAICTGFMALGMMLPGMMAGWLQETIGYRHFFVWAMICCLATFIVCAFIKIDPQFGKKESK